MDRLRPCWRVAMWIETGTATWRYWPNETLSGGSGNSRGATENREH
jgi:hypothetical protein